jgi:acetoin utilization deacetylase AcuC-like enzyme
MKTGYLYDPVFLTHTLRGHPENAARLEAVVSYLDREGLFESLVSLPFVAASKHDLEAVHERVYIDGLEKLSMSGGGMLGLDTYVTCATYHAASMAAGASVAAARAVLGGQVRRAFALVRPPGHHAFVGHGEGFCLFNNIAMGAAYALGRLPDKPATALDRVMIIDWDVHHGNGTESIFYSDPAVLYLSTHQSPLYPGTGRIVDTGRGAGVGYNINIPLPPGVGDRGYHDVFESIVTAAATRYKPQLILVSAGYDCHWRDRLAGMSMSLVGFTTIMQKIAQLSDTLCDARLVVELEGGYDLDVMQYGVFNTFKVLQNDLQSTLDPIGPYIGEEAAIEPVIRKVRRLHNL